MQIVQTFSHHQQQDEQLLPLDSEMKYFGNTNLLSPCPLLTSPKMKNDIISDGDLGKHREANPVWKKVKKSSELLKLSGHSANFFHLRLF